MQKRYRPVIINIIIFIDTLKIKECNKIDIKFITMKFAPKFV